MIKIADKDKDYVYIYSENFSEISDLLSKTKVALSTTYDGCPAIVVKKDKEKCKIDPCLN